MTPRISLQSCLVLLITANSLRPSAAETSTCLTVYREGGAPAVLRSPKCPRWNLFSDDRRGRPAYNCQVALHQGRRRSQEDRAVCTIDVRIPFVGVNGLRDVSVGIIAVFDGHNGGEASEMASKLLLEYFFLHVHFLLDGLYSAALTGPVDQLVHEAGSDVFSQSPNGDVGQRWRNFDFERYRWILPRIFDSNLHLEILKESLLRTIHDIDVTFSKEAFRKGFHSGSTATVVLLANGKILVVNVGDSKAILCSESFDPPLELKAGNTLRLSRRGRRNRATFPIKNYKTSDAVTYYQQKYVHVKELTRDHHPDREDEKNRVEASGGFVEWSGVPRVNGMLAVSRAIGDVSLKSYGVIATPEITDWQRLGSNDSYLIVATDGVFEKLTAQDACDLLWDTNTQGDVKPEFIFNIAPSLADHIVRNALERGTMDNLAAVVVPLMPSGIPIVQIKDIHKEEGRKGTSYSGSENFEYIKSDRSVNGSSLISVEYFNKITTNFNKLVVETNSEKLGCFYLSENLNNNKDYDFLQAKIHQKTRVHDFSASLSEALKCNHNAEIKRLYNVRTFCSLFVLDLGLKSHGSDHGNFEKFFGLLDSFSYNGTGFDSTDPPEYKLPDLRYTLERQFGGGSYGEVWLAFQWNCSEVGGNFSRQHEKLNSFHEDLHVYNTTLHNKSSCGYYFSGDDDNSYILKRIKVEKGNAAYRSGLREKYFGEMFLRASNGCITTISTSSLLDVGCTACGTLEFDEHDPLKLSHGCSCNREAYEGLAHIARFVEYFESPSEGIWLVFRNEGLSLKKLLYSDKEQVFGDADSDDQVKKPLIFRPSSWWRWLRTTETGRREMRNLIHQLLLALKACHVRNITHRDIKPENMIICFEDTSSRRCLKRIPSGRNYYHPRLHLIDFGSAIDKFTLRNLYGSGPTRSEQTFAYSSPEALLNASWFQAPNDVVMKYDMWSVGVVMMELILGSPNIFETSARTRALIYQQLEGWSEDVKELAYKLRSYMDMCIIVPGIFPKYHFQDHDKVSCSEESFSEQIKRRDPLKLGFPNVWAVRFVHQLLVWEPEDRLSIDEALQHPYFHYDI